METRLHQHIEFDTNGGCWLWGGPLNVGGYGQIFIRRDAAGKQIREPAHRLTYRLFKGDVPPGLQLDHLCRVRCCCNPDHLEAVTPRVNTMRSNAQSAINARKTHCKRGHAFAPDNTYVNSRGERVCRTCHLRQLKDARQMARERNHIDAVRAGADAPRDGEEPSAAVRVVCKGAWSLGSACGRCPRCLGSAPAEIERLKQAVKNADADADMYAKAWQRELGSWMAGKRHHIDACVVGTRNLVASEREQRTWLDGLKRWRVDAALARTLGVPDPDLLAYLPPSPMASAEGDATTGNSGTGGE